MAAIRALLTRPTSLHHFYKSILKPLYLSTRSRTKPQFPFPSDFPQKLHHKNFISLSKLLLKYGFPSSHLPSFLNQNQFLLQFSPPKVESSIRIILSLNPSQEFLLSLITNCPGVLDHDFMQKWEKGIDKMKASGINSTAIRHIVELCKRFDLNPEDVLTCVECLKGLGFSQGTLDKVLDGFPSVIMMNEGRIQDKLEFFANIGIERKDVDRILGLFPGVLAFGVENKLKPLIEELTELGFSLDVVKKELIREPRVLGLEIGELSHCLRVLRSLKCRVGIRENIFAKGAFRAGYELKLRVDCLRKYGLMYRDAFSVLWKEPRAILYDIKDIENKIDFLLHTMKCEILCLVDVPEYLGVNLEKQIMPRFKVIENLRSVGGLGDEVGLRSLIKPSRLKFYNLYVKPYPECEKIYSRFSNVEGRNQHPVGMWKLFKPQKFEDSREDVKRIKVYMESLA